MPIIKLDGGNEFGYGFDLWLIGIMYLVEFVCGTNEQGEFMKKWGDNSYRFSHNRMENSHFIR